MISVVNAIRFAFPPWNISSSKEWTIFNGTVNKPKPLRGIVTSLMIPILNCSPQSSKSVIFDVVQIKFIANRKHSNKK